MRALLLPPHLASLTDADAAFASLGLAAAWARDAAPSQSRTMPGLHLAQQPGRTGPGASVGAAAYFDCVSRPAYSQAELGRLRQLWEPSLNLKAPLRLLVVCIHLQSEGFHNVYDRSAFSAPVTGPTGELSGSLFGGALCRPGAVRIPYSVTLLRRCTFLGPSFSLVSIALRRTGEG